MAGWLVLRLRPAGRVLGIVLASIGIVTGLVQIGSTGGAGLLAIALNAFVLYGLFTYGFVFKTGSRPDRLGPGRRGAGGSASDL